MINDGDHFFFFFRKDKPPKTDDLVWEMKSGSGWTGPYFSHIMHSDPPRLVFKDGPDGKRYRFFFGRKSYLAQLGMKPNCYAATVAHKKNGEVFEMAGIPGFLENIERLIASHETKVKLANEGGTNGKPNNH